jgi:hypothetical protein
MQINRTGYFLLGLFFVGGVIFTVLKSRSSPSRSSSARSGSCSRVRLGIYALRQADKGRHEQWLFRSGVRGKGTLVSARSGALSTSSR